MKVHLQEVAAARTRVVLQHPGGPYRRTPLGRLRPRRAKDSGCFRGHSIAWQIENFVRIYRRSQRNTCIHVRAHGSRFYSLVSRALYSTLHSPLAFWARVLYVTLMSLTLPSCLPLFTRISRVALPLCAEAFNFALASSTLRPCIPVCARLALCRRLALSALLQKSRKTIQSPPRWNKDRNVSLLAVSSVWVRTVLILGFRWIFARSRKFPKKRACLHVKYR